MEKIVWSREYETGIKKIDLQHKVLIRYINTFYDALKDGEEKKVMLAITKGLLDYIVIHFDTMEKLLVNNNSSNLKEHLSEYEYVAKKIQRLQYELNNLTLSTFNRVYTYLRTWLQNHLDSSVKKIEQDANSHHSHIYN